MRSLKKLQVGVLQVALVTLGRHIGLLNNWYCLPEENEVRQILKIDLDFTQCLFRFPQTPSFFLCQRTLLVKLLEKSLKKENES